MRKLLLLLGLFTGLSGQAQSPNILMITLEDTSPQFIGAYGNAAAHTPNIDRLLGQGTRFTAAFAPAPVCAVARNALITGVSPNKMGTGHHRSRYPIPAWIRGFPAYLRDLGYYTSNNVKTDYNTSREPDIIAASWDESSRQAGWWKRAPGQPFFSVFNIAASHQSRTMTHPRRWYEEFVLRHLPQELRTTATEVVVPPVFRDSPPMRAHLARMQNSINYADLQVGVLLDSLERHGLRDSTVILLFADHGEAIPGGKCTPTGLGYRVPFGVWFPRSYRHLSPWKKAGATDELVIFQDIGPSLIALAGGTPPDYMDGRSLFGTAREKPPTYVYPGRNRIDETPDLARSITDGRFIYTRNFLPYYPPLKPQKYADVADVVKTIRADGEAGHLNPVQRRILDRQPEETLYDLTADPWELNNLVNDPAYASRKKKMARTLRRHILSEGDLHFLPEAYLARLSQPYYYRADRQAYKLGKALRAAWLMTGDPKREAELLSALGSKSPLARYWAATNLGQTALSPAAETALRSVLRDEDPAVAIAAAGALSRWRGDEAAAAVLEQHIFGEAGYHTLAALQQVQFAGTHLAHFIPILEKRLRQLTATPLTDPNLNLSATSIIETTLFLAGKRQDLFYENMKKWQ